MLTITLVVYIYIYLVVREDSSYKAMFTAISAGKECNKNDVVTARATSVLNKS